MSGPIATYSKQPAERKDYDVLYDEWLATDAADTLDNVDAVVTVLTGVDDEASTLVVDLVELTATTAKLWVRGGTSGVTYKVEVTASTQRGRIDQSEIKFKVKDN